MTKYIFVATISLTANLLLAQQPTSVDTTAVDTVQIIKKIEVDEVQVIKAFEVTLGEAKRIGIGPKLEKVDPVEKKYDYDITIVPAEIEYADPIIKPLAMRPDPKADLDHFYAKLGYGMLKSPYADLSFFRNIPELYSLTVSGHHYSLDNTNQIANQKLSESNLSLDGDYLLGENTLLSGHLFGKIDQLNLYNTFLTDLLINEDVSRGINTFGGRLGIANAEKIAGSFSYDVNLGVMQTSLEDNYPRIANQSKEYNFSFDGGVAKQIGTNFSIYLTEDIYFDRLTVAGLGRDMVSMDGNLGIRWTKGIFNLHAAADVIIVSNKIDPGLAVDPFVDIELGVAVAPGIQFFMGADQELIRNNLHPTLTRNTFTAVSLDLLNNTSLERYYGGVRGKLLSNLTFDAVVGYEDISNQYYFDGATTSAALPIAFQDAMNIAIDANIEFTISENSSVGGRLNHNFYDPSQTEQLFNIPSYTYEAYANIGLLNNKLQIKGSLGLQESIFYLNRTQAELPLLSGNRMTDLSIEVDYFITKSIAVWARGNNLLDNKYQQFAGYPTIGLQALGGILVKF